MLFFVSLSLSLYPFLVLALNATMRTINLTTSILAPVVVGQIITYGSQVAGAVFIAMWNLISGIIEYNLLYQIYKMIPQLGAKTIAGGNGNGIPFIKIGSPESESSSPGTQEGLPLSLINGSSRPGKGRDTKGEGNNNSANSTNRMLMMTPEMTSMKGGTRLQVNEDGVAATSPETFTGVARGGLLTPGAEFEDISLVTPESLKKGSASSQGYSGPGVPNGNYNAGGRLSSSVPTSGTAGRNFAGGESTNKVDTSSRKTSASLQVSHQKAGGNTAWKGWRSYFSHHVKFAGLALACLYMTALGFDSITTGLFRVERGKWLVGISHWENGNIPISH
jgi:hypothetical protein